MIVDIVNEILTKLKTDLVGVTVYTSNPLTVPDYPCIIVRELSNSTHTPTRDSGGEKYNEVGVEINIFTNGSSKMSDGKEIRSNVDAIMSGHYNMNRIFGEEVPNYADQSIYRFIMRYNVIVDVNRTIYNGR
jgi:hypothetical protein